MKEEELNKALDNRSRAERKQRIINELLSYVSKLEASTPSSIGGWHEFYCALGRLNEFDPDTRQPILVKMSEVLRTGFTEMSARLREEITELDREFEAMW